MVITSDQCRAARSLLGWTQEQLAINAHVSRATIVDFESNLRQPMTNNLRSIRDCMLTAGVEFISEQGKSGVGVRFHERKLEYINKIKIDWSQGTATIPMRYAGENFLCMISREAIEDYHSKNIDTDNEFAKATTQILDNVILTAVRRHVPDGIVNGKLIIKSNMLE